jgi:stage V sporulation protein D (sporulation-specific penicillin-binding protein)
MKKRQKGSSPQKVERRLALIVFLIFVGFAVLLGRLLYWNLSSGHEFEKTVLNQQNRSSSEINYERGKIYDANGKVLATNERQYSLILEPKNLLVKVENSDGEEVYQESTQKTLEAIEKYLGYSQEDVLAKMEENPDSLYLVYAKELSYDDISDMKKFMEMASKKKANAKSDEEKEEIAWAEQIYGIYFLESYKRIYPNDSVACHLLGFSNSANEGQWGIEKYYNEELNGVNGRKFSYMDEDMNTETTVKDAIDGNSLVTTINLDIQKAIEKRRQAFDDETGSEMTTITVMDPNSGEILGMTTSYDYDLNNPSDETVLQKLYSTEEISTFKANQEIVDEGGTLERTDSSEILTTTDAFSTVWKNSVLTDTFEPGSTYKPFTVASALEENVYDGTEGFSCTGSLTVGSTKIACSHTHGDIEFKDSIAKSCNVALMTIGLREGKEIFTEYQKIFGFGQKTGIDLPGEANTSNLLYSADDMTNVDLATNTFGQNFNVTGIQLISAFCSLINGGYYYQPHVVKQIIDADGNVKQNIDKTLVRTTVSKDTSDKLREMLQETVLSGTGTKAAIKGYTIGGKTGTAEKISEVTVNGKTRRVRNKTDYLVSFIAFTPVENPQYVIYVTIDQPHVDYQANAGLAVELERKCMKDIIKITGLKKSSSEE